MTPKEKAAELKTVVPGESIAEILSFQNRIHINISRVQYISKAGKIICGFQPFTGLSRAALDQFTKSYLNTFKCYSKVEDLAKNIELFKKRYTKVTKMQLDDVVTIYPAP